MGDDCDTISPDLNSAESSEAISSEPGSDNSPSDAISRESGLPAGEDPSLHFTL